MTFLDTSKNFQEAVRSSKEFFTLIKRLVVWRPMYGKHFESMYTGSMVGIGAIPFAVWGYVISHQRPPRFEVELNPIILATIIGEDAGDIEKAIVMFCEPDLKSRTEDMEGRKLERLGPFLFRVVNGARYDAIRSNEERKAYWRDQKKKSREAMKEEVSPDKKPESEAKPPRKKFIKPVREQVMLAAAKLGLSELEADKFFSYYEANGWRVGKNPMKSWEHALGGWKMRVPEMVGSPGAAGSKPPSVFEMKTVLDAKEKAAQKLKNQHATETALGIEWDSDESMLAHRKLRQEIKQLSEQLASKF